MSNALILADSQNYPLLDLFWTMFEFFIFVLWIFLLIRIFSDIFRSHDLNGWGKTGWSVLIIVLPLIGVLVYLIARGGSMHERDVKQAQANQQAFDDYVKKAAGTTNTSDELAKLAGLRDSGVLTEAEFTAQKAKLLS